MSKRESSGLVRKYRDATDHDVVRGLLSSYEKAGLSADVFLDDLTLPESEREVFPVGLVHESPKGDVDAALTGSPGLIVLPFVDPQAVKPRDRLAVMMALIEATEHEMLARRLLNLNVFPTPAVLGLAEGLKTRGFICCDWFYRSPYVRQFREKLM